MTAIEWTDRTWNPVTGCDRTSPGCDNCYALMDDHPPQHRTGEGRRAVNDLERWKISLASIEAHKKGQP